MSITSDMYDGGALALLIYSGITLLFTFPLVLHLSSRLPYDLGDPLLTSAVVWWNAHAVPFTDRWWDGFGFFPAGGSTAFSADQLGASLISTPLQWLGASPIAAYNVVFLISWPLSAYAAHVCARAVTGREDAAYIAGLAYGFNPLRVAHVEHLELLMAFGMPAALAALHKFLQTRRPAWAAGFAAALIVQALSSSYYALFFTSFFGLWLVWFVRPREWRPALALAAAGAAAVAIVSPVFLGYRRIHDLYGMQRKFEEVLTYSADVSSFVTASALSGLWGWTSHLNGSERQLFPGATIVLLGIAGIAQLVRARGPKPLRQGHGGPPEHSAKGEGPTLRDAGERPGSAKRLSRISMSLALAFATTAVLVGANGPFRLELGPLRVSASDLYKPLSVAVGLAILAVAFSQRMRAAFRDRSVLAFYLIATVALLFCSLGPEPTFLGRRILYQPPYAWLMQLPFFSDTVRVPARFGMLAILALSLAASIAYAQLSTRSSRRRLMFGVVVAGILADGWMRALPLAVPPRSFSVPHSGEAVGAVLELPLGDVMGDTAAMYRVTMHDTRTVNGYNGYEPRYYHVLRLALADRDDTVLQSLTSLGPLLVAVNRQTPEAAEWVAFVSRQPGSKYLGDDNGWRLLHLPRSPAQPPGSCPGGSIPIAGIRFNDLPLELAPLVDGDSGTRWITPRPQRRGDTLVLDLGRVARPCSLTVSMGAEGELYPRRLEVATSTDAQTWSAVMTGGMGGAAFRAVLANPLDARTTTALPGEPARFIRLRLAQSDRVYQWATAGVMVKGG